MDVDDSKKKTKTPFCSRRAVCSRSINTFKALQIKLGIPLWAALYIPSSLVQNALPRSSRAASDRSVAEKQFARSHLERRANQRAVFISVYSVAAAAPAQGSVSFYQWRVELGITNHRKPLARANSWLQRWLASRDLSKPSVPASLLPPQHQYHYANLSVSTQFIFQFPAGCIPTLSVCHLSFHRCMFYSSSLVSLQALLCPPQGS